MKLLEAVDNGMVNFTASSIREKVSIYPKAASPKVHKEPRLKEVSSAGEFIYLYAFNPMVNTKSAQLMLVSLTQGFGYGRHTNPSSSTDCPKIKPPSQFYTEVEFILNRRSPFCVFNPVDANEDLLEAKVDGLHGLHGLQIYFFFFMPVAISPFFYPSLLCVRANGQNEENL